MLTWFTYHDHDPRKSLCGTMWIQHECYKIKIRRIYAICLLCPVIFLKRNLMHDDRVRFLGDYDELWFFSHIGLASSPTTAFRISIGLLSYPVPRFSASPMQRLRSSAGVMWHLGCQQCLPITGRRMRESNPAWCHDAPRQRWSIPGWDWSPYPWLAGPLILWEACNSQKVDVLSLRWYQVGSRYRCSAANKQYYVILWYTMYSTCA